MDESLCPLCRTVSTLDTRVRGEFRLFYTCPRCRVGFTRGAAPTAEERKARDTLLRYAAEQGVQL